MVTVQVGALPEQAPPQPPKVFKPVVLAVRVTGVLKAKSNAQVVPQLMPGGALVITPSPFFSIVSLCAPGGLKVAVTLWA